MNRLWLRCFGKGGDLLAYFAPAFPVGEELGVLGGPLLSARAHFLRPGLVAAARRNSELEAMASALVSVFPRPVNLPYERR